MTTMAMFAVNFMAGIVMALLIHTILGRVLIVMIIIFRLK